MGLTEDDSRVRDPRHELLVHKPELETFEKTWTALSDVADKRKFIEELQTRVEAARAVSISRLVIGDSMLSPCIVIDASQTLRAK